MKRIILIIQENESDYDYLFRKLVQAGFSKDDVVRYNSVKDWGGLIEEDVKVILADSSLYATAFNESTNTLSLHFPNTPFIAFSHSVNEDSISELIRNGAQDVLVHGQFSSADLGKAIFFAIERQAQCTIELKKVTDYRAHFNNGPIPMWIVDNATMRFVDVNFAAVEKYGYSREEFLGMSLKDIRPAEDVAEITTKFYQPKCDQYKAGQWRHKKKNGDLFVVEVHSHDTEFESRPARLGFIVDINEKMFVEKKNKELLELLEVQKEQLDNILLSIPQAIWSMRADRDELIYGNEACSRLFGFSPNEIMSDKFLFLKSIVPDDRTIYFKALKSVKSKGRAEAEFRYRASDGNIKILKTEATLRKGINGKPDTLNGVTIDVTDERELQDKIRQSEQNLKATINNTRDLIWSVDTNLRIIYCNHAYRDFVHELAGFVPQQGDYVLADSGSESFLDKRTKDYQRALKGETFITVVEEEYNGEHFYKEISNNPIINHNGQITGVNCIARDISEQKQQLSKIREQNEKLREIAWIQSHRVRGPVASILGLAELLNYDVLDSEVNRDILLQLKMATNNLDAIIKEVVDKTNSIDKLPAIDNLETLHRSKSE